MKVTLTTMSGNTHNINLMNRQEVYDFIDLFKSTLNKNQRVKITCDLLGINGIMQGTRQGETPASVLTNYCQFFFQIYTSYKQTKYSDFAKMKFYSDFQILPGQIRYNKSMGILENFENAWDIDFQFESKPIIEKDNLGQPVIKSDEVSL